MSFDRYKIYNGKSIADWSKETGIKAGTLAYRLRNGMTLEEAILKPVMKSSECAKKHDIIGKTFTDRFGNEYIVEGLAYRDKYSVAYYKCHFLKTGYVTNAVASQIIGTGHAKVQDRLAPSVFGVGIMGYAHRSDNPKLFDVWRAMIARCYNLKNPNYKTYGAKGVTVCERWKRYDLFLEDVCNIQGYDQEAIDAGILVLDKDIINREARCYSLETCCFVTKSENAREALARRWGEKKCNDYPARE